MTPRILLRIGVAAALVGAGLITAVPASAQYPCGNFEIWGNGGGRCDSAPNPDGSFTRCDTVYVLGIGGTNCYWVPPGTPH